MNDVDPRGEQTGVADVREAMARLDALDGQPVAAHVGVYDDVHTVLQGALAGLDEA